MDDRREFALRVLAESAKHFGDKNESGDKNEGPRLRHPGPFYLIERLSEARARKL